MGLQLTTPDVIVLAVILAAAVRGAWKGMAWQLVRTVGLVAALWLAATFDEPFGAWLGERVGFLENVASFAAWFLIFLGAIAVATWFAWMAKGAMQKVLLGGVDRLFGFLLGGVMGLLLATVGFLAWGNFVSDEYLQETMEGSVSLAWMHKVVDTAEPLLPTAVLERWQPFLHRLHEVPGAPE